MKTHINEECPSCSSIGAIPVSKTEENPRLSHWPIQIKLIGTVAPFLNDADLLVAADCTAFAVHDFHKRFLKDKKVLIGCPKLDDAMSYVEKFAEIFSNIPLKSVSCLRMEVPCCGGLVRIARQALQNSGKDLPFESVLIRIAQ